LETTRKIIDHYEFRDAGEVKDILKFLVRNDIESHCHLPIIQYLSVIAISVRLARSRLRVLTICDIWSSFTAFIPDARIISAAFIPLSPSSQVGLLPPSPLGTDREVG
jgi:hypothetical protein